MSALIPAAVAAVIATWNVVAAGDAAAWLAARHGYLTASDVAAVLGLHPHKSRAAVVKAKQGPPDLAPRSVPAMRAGHFLEPAILEWYLDDLRRQAVELGEASPEGAQCRNPEGTSVLVAHPDPGLRLAASPDGIIVGVQGSELVEVKVHGPRQWAKWDGQTFTAGHHERRRVVGLPTADDWPGCPVQHWVQLQVQLLCTGVSHGLVLGNCGSERREHHFDADPAFHARVLEATVKFWECVKRTGRSC